MRRVPLAVVALACVVLLQPGAGGAQSSLPPRVMPKVGDGHDVRRNFTVEVVRDGRVLVRVRAVIACHGHIVGIPPAFQSVGRPCGV